MTINRRIIAALSAAIVFAAGAGPAWAGEFNLNGSGSYVQVPPTTRVALEQSRHQGVSPTIVHVTAGSGGFDWGDAGIGAGAGIAISVLVLGGLTVSGRDTGRHIHHA